MALSSRKESSPSVNLHVADVKVADGKAFVGYNNSTNNTYNTYNTYKGYYASIPASHYGVHHAINVDAPDILYIASHSVNQASFYYVASRLTFGI
jgi:hypothetical protein